MTNDATVGLDFGFARTSRPDTTGLSSCLTTGLAGERSTPATQSGQHVLQLGQLHLGLTLATGCVLGEDVKNQGGPVHHLDLGHILQCTPLGGMEVVVGDDCIRLKPGNDIRQFPGLARPHIGGRVGLGPLLEETIQDLCTSCLRQRRQLTEGLLGLLHPSPGIGPYANQNDPFKADLPVLDLGYVPEFTQSLNMSELIAPLALLPLHLVHGLGCIPGGLLQENVRTPGQTVNMSRRRG